MNDPLAHLNGRLVPFADAGLPLHDAGFVSGATVVDNARTFRHALFRWPDHLARFRRDCETCYVPLLATDEQLTATALALIEHNAELLPPGGELQVVTFATPGPLGVYLDGAPNGPPTLGMVTYPLPFARYRPFFTDGVTLAVVGGGSRRDSILPPTVKHRSRMLWHVADHQARTLTGNPAALALLADGGMVTETSVANVLAVVDGAVVAPPRADALDGISLRVTRELCGGLGLPFVHAPLSTVHDLDRASELLLTGTAFCLAGAREVVRSGASARQFGGPGPVFRRLLAAWSDLVGVDIERQFSESGA